MALSKNMGFGEIFGTEPHFDLTCSTLQAQISNLRNLTGRYFSPLLTPIITHSSEPMFSKFTPKHKVCQVHQGCDYTRANPAQELELILAKSGQI